MDRRLQTNYSLPRSNTEGSFLPVKIKRELTCKQRRHEYQCVDPMHVKPALQYLKQMNVLFLKKDVEFNDVAEHIL